MDIQWHVPSSEEINFAFYLLDTFLQPELTKLEHYATGKLEMSRSVVICNAEEMHLSTHVFKCLLPVVLALQTLRSKVLECYIAYGILKIFPRFLTFQSASKLEVHFIKLITYDNRLFCTEKLKKKNNNNNNNLRTLYIVVEKWMFLIYTLDYGS